MLALPADTACTTPCDDTVATAEFEELHVGTMIPRETPALVTAVAESVADVPLTRDRFCTTEPSLRIVIVRVVGVVGVVVPLVTVTADVPETLSDVALIVVLPALRARTMPDVETVATLVAEEVHVISRPWRTFPYWSFTWAESLTESPSLTEGVEGVIVTEAAPAGLANAQKYRK